MHSRLAVLIIATTAIFLAQAPVPPTTPSPTPKPRAGGDVRVKVEKGAPKSPEAKIPRKQHKAIEATQKGHNAPSWDPDHGPLMD